MPIDEIYKNYIKNLNKIYDEREATNITNWVFESVAGIKPLQRVLNKEREFDDLTILQFENVLHQLLQYKPIQYILNEAWFYKIKFFVDENVLIPRPETEELVEWAIEEIKIHNLKFKILDIGTGSGCIAIALKKEIPNAEIFAIDVSEEALKVAKKNAAAQDVKIDFIQSDFLNKDSSSILESFDIIISNPPYIPAIEKNKLNKNVTEHEPHLALFVADNDQFIFYKRIATFVQEHLNKNGKIFVEVHEDFSKQVSEIFNQCNFKTENKKDIYGRSRMVKAFR